MTNQAQDLTQKQLDAEFYSKPFSAYLSTQSIKDVIYELYGDFEGNYALAEDTLFDVLDLTYRGVTIDSIAYPSWLSIWQELIEENEGCNDVAIDGFKLYFIEIQGDKVVRVSKKYEFKCRCFNVYTRQYKNTKSIGLSDTVSKLIGATTKELQTA